MRSSTRFAVLMVLALGMLSFSAIPALAKGAPGEDPAVRTVVLFGPNMRVPAVFQGQAALDFARDSGMLDAANLWSTVATTVSPATSSLGPRYTATYVFGFEVTTSLHLDGDSVTQDLYPYAAGGPIAFTPPGQRLHASGWWRVAPNLTSSLQAVGLRGLPGTSPATTAAAGSSNAGTTWALWIALGIVGLIALLDVTVGRRRSPAVISS